MKIFLEVLIILVPSFFIIFSIVNIIRKIKFYLASRRLYKNFNETNLREYIKTLSKISVTNNPRSWNELRSVFSQINNSQKISYDIKTELYRVLIQKGCNLRNMKVNKNNEEIKKEKEDRIRKSGIQGEKNVAYNLKWLPDEYKVLHNVMLNHEIEKQEFDTIVIGPNGVFHLETKNEGGDYGCEILIDNAGNWHKTNNYNEEIMTSPVFQLNRHDKVLKDTLKKYFKEKTYSAIGIIVLSNYKTAVEGVENCEVPVIKVENLAKYISNYECSEMLSKDEINSIYNKINEIRLKCNRVYIEDIQEAPMQEESIIVANNGSILGNNIFSKRINRIITILIIIFLLPVVVAMINGTKNNESSTPMSASNSKERVEAKNAETEVNKVDTSVVIDVQADQLVDSYKENAVGCKTKYNNKLVSVTGTIGLIGNLGDGSAYVLLCYKGDCSVSIRRVQCIFNKNNLNCIADLKKGQQVTIKGECMINSSEIQLNESNIEI